MKVYAAIESISPEGYILLGIFKRKIDAVKAAADALTDNPFYRTKFDRNQILKIARERFIEEHEVIT